MAETMTGPLQLIVYEWSRYLKTRQVHKEAESQKGTPNKLTTTFREAVLLTYDGVGGHTAFMKWARENQTEFYRIAARLIPTEMGVKDQKLVVIMDRQGRYTTPERSRVEQH
jgi:hypothetical protein